MTHPSSPLATEQEIRRAYADGEVAASYIDQRFTNELQRLLHERQVRAVQRVMDNERPRRILEVAPGPGRLTRDLSATAIRICLEYNAEMISEGRRNCDRSVAWIRGDGFHLPFQGQFDLLYTFRFIRHFKDIDRRRLYSQVRSVLSPRGIFIFDAVNEHVSAPLREQNPAGYPVFDKLYRDEDEIRRELKDEGFEIQGLEPVQRWYSAQYRAQVLLGPRSRKLCRLAVRGLERLRRGPALEWIVTCRRA